MPPAILSECMYFLAGFLTENSEGGESWGTSVFGASLSPPTTSSTSRRGAVGSAASREGCLAASLALRVRAARKRAPRPALTYLAET